MNTRRAYSMATRGKQSAATRARILDVTQAMLEDPASDLTLEQIATASGVSVQTVLRAFGSKQELVVAAIGTVRYSTVREEQQPPTTRAEAVSRLFDDYEVIGDRVVRMLAEEHRVPGLAEAAAEGRLRHRAWLEAAFAADLRRFRGRRRAEVTTALVAATDIYLWKLLRRDLGLGRPAAETAIRRLVHGALEPTAPEPTAQARGEEG